MQRICWIAVTVSALCCSVCSSVLASSEVYLTDAMGKSTYVQSLSNLLKGSRDLPVWTKQTLKASGDYVGDPMTNSMVDGVSYELFTTCKPHDCSDNQFEVMFAPNGAQAWAAYSETGKPIVFLGTPSAAQKLALKAALQH
jgi:hypothetical protein